MNVEIKQVKTNELQPAKYNPRKWSEVDTANLRKSIERFGMVDPIIVNSAPKRKGIIIGGHFRLKVAKDLGMKTVPVVFVNISDEKRERELNLRLNKNIGTWDWESLANFDLTELENVGFNEKELNQHFDIYPADEKDDDVPEVPKKHKSKLGELYRLGNHMVMCGDSTKAEDVGKLMEGKKADMVFTDPPYGVNYGADQETLNKKSGNKSKLVARPIVGDNLTTEECAKRLWRPAFKNLYENAKDECTFYMTMCQGGDQMMMMMMMMSENWQIKHELIWIKSSPVFSMGRLDYDYQHEPILYGWKKKHNWYGNGQFLKSVWEIPKPSKSELHPTMKPIELIQNAILNSSKEEDIILDLFLGSGSTLIAAEKTGRICYGMEIDPHYCDVIIKRWEDFTGRKAELLGSTDGEKGRKIKNEK